MDTSSIHSPGITIQVGDKKNITPHALEADFIIWSTYYIQDVSVSAVWLESRAFRDCTVWPFVKSGLKILGLYPKLEKRLITRYLTLLLVLENKAQNEQYFYKFQTEINT